MTMQRRKKRRTIGAVLGGAAMLTAALGLGLGRAEAAVFDPATGSIVSSMAPIYGAARAHVPPTRTIVDFRGPEAPGTIIVESEERRLYLVLPGGKAVRYDVGVGRPGFGWSGRKTVTRMAEWPDWRPPAAMLKRRPDLPRFMEGGEGNPLGARALYLGQSIYRIHGSNEPETIGQAVSSGCIRMLNEDVIDLYSRVRVGTLVVMR